MKKKLTYSVLVVALLIAGGCGEDDSKSVTPLEEPVQSSSSVALESSSSVMSSTDVVESSSSVEVPESSEAKQDSLPSIQSSFVWNGEKGDVPREYFNSHVKNLSSDSTFMLAPEVLGVATYYDTRGAFILEKISLEDAKKNFPNTIETMQKDGIPLKEEYYQIYVPLESALFVNMLTKVDRDTLFTTFSYQANMENSYAGWAEEWPEVWPEGCFTVEEDFYYLSAIYLVDTDEDLSNAVLAGGYNFNHSWTCDCMKTKDESCWFLSIFYEQDWNWN